ncbi:MAG: aspartate-semialdehyde dehydrogenase [Deltaproteobacteria bacterium]|nr:aspartate-semialdehyde dehydrogenase [SAR324 cluster bacterium]
MSQVVAIAGATGAVGTEFIKLLEQRNYPLQKLKLLASARSVGKQLRFREQTLTVEELRPEAFQDVDVAFFSAGGDRSKEFAPAAVEAGALVIDNSSAFRMDDGVPLVVPEINAEAARRHRGLIANPNCSTIQMVVALNPLHQESPLQRVVVSTYQAVSGAGASGMQELLDQVRDYTQGKPLTPQAFPKQILFNLIPHIDVFQENGYTKEEMKMVLETRKIMSIPELPVSATCVRVPVLRAHSESIWVETETKISEARARELFVQAPGIQLVDERKPGGYPVPWEASETFDTYVGRVREDLSHPRGLTFWCVADQLYKGAALNAIQIAEVLLES